MREQTQKTPEIKSVLEVYELEGGQFVAVHSDFPELAGSGPALEDAIVELFELASGELKTSRKAH